MTDERFLELLEASGASIPQENITAVKNLILALAHKTADKVIADHIPPKGLSPNHKSSTMVTV